MLLRFKTKVNKNGWNRKLTIDTANKQYSRQPFSIFDEAVILTGKEYKNMIEYLEKAGCTETFKYL